MNEFTYLSSDLWSRSSHTLKTTSSVLFSFSLPSQGKKRWEWRVYFLLSCPTSSKLWALGSLNGFRLPSAGRIVEFCLDFLRIMNAIVVWTWSLKRSVDIICQVEFSIIILFYYVFWKRKSQAYQVNQNAREEATEKVSFSLSSLISASMISILFCFCCRVEYFCQHFVRRETFAKWMSVLNVHGVLLGWICLL